MRLVVILLGLSMLFQACGSFESKRVSRDESDELASTITDKWVGRDTELAIDQMLTQLKKHRGYQRYLRNVGRPPKLFVGEVQNMTSEPYFPLDDLNDELLVELSATGDYILIDAAARENILKEITYQNDGMVNPVEAKMIGKQSGADLMIFGAVRMDPKSRDGKTIKEYTVNFRLTDIERGIEVARTRIKVNKYSEQDSSGW